MNLYLIRHGETELNRIGGHFQGQIEVPLNENGIRQAQEAGAAFRAEGIRFDHVISSPLGRAVQTGRLVSGLTRIETDDRLLEQGFGPFEGRRYEEMDEARYRQLRQDPMNYVPPVGGESILTVLKRTSQFLEDMKHDARGGNILVSAHGGSVRGILMALHEMDPNYFWEYEMGNCAWYQVEIQDGTARLIATQNSTDMKRRRNDK